MQYSARYSKPFAERHHGTQGDDVKAMLDTVGVASIEELISKTIPANIRLPKDLELGDALTEQEFLTMLKGKAAKNKLFKHHIGMGYYDTLTPGVVLRNIMENPGWYTAYTPYQAEIAQGRLEALLNYQTMVIDLSGMEIANASLLDEGTAAAEAMNMFRAADKKGVAHRFFVDQHT
ncbi:MAG: glycine dehydrogenase (aminomethyl-transferring), partial [Bacteroidia bacterium]